jgi:hypothetical protein
LLWAYGVQHIAMMASRSVWTVRADIRSGKLDPTTPFAVVAYALDKRGQREAARVVASQAPAAVVAREEQDR